MSELFKNLKIKYPVFTVILPQSGDKLEVRSLNVSEVSSLRKSTITITSAPDHVTRIIFGAIENLPAEITYEEFIKNLTVRDREALVYGVFVMTFGEKRVFEIGCDSCGRASKVTLDVTGMFSINQYPYSKKIINTYKLARSMGAEPDVEIEQAIESRGITYKKLDGVESPPAGMPIDIAEREFPDYFEKYNSILQKNVEAKKEEIVSGKRKVVIEEWDGDEEVTSEDIISEKVTQPVIVESVSTPVIKAKKDEDPLDIFTRRIRIILPIAKMEAYIKQPTVHDEKFILDNYTSINDDQFSYIEETMVIDKFVIVEDNGNKVEVTDRTDIAHLYGQLPMRDRETIFEEYNKNLGEFGIKLETKWNCTFTDCRAENQYELNIIQLFFRSLAQS